MMTDTTFSPACLGLHISVILAEPDVSSTKVPRSVELHRLTVCTSLHRNPWLPGWILTTTLILSVLVLIWICCATVATAVDQYVPAEKLSIYGDNDCIKEQKLTPYPPSSLIIITSKDPKEEAGPLPSKVNLGQSNI
ncbi:Transmembrane protein 59 [Characodon lateralis]|uniref:Transmembrane protein 59 n=1 Tax=Characodon lateralis TaxID=208331 RepID=A0ABU7D027_9TELE|nr:Transmembrane protein 59 [Characodon lateralis]